MPRTRHFDEAERTVRQERKRLEREARRKARRAAVSRTIELLERKPMIGGENTDG